MTRKSIGSRWIESQTLRAEEEKDDVAKATVPKRPTRDEFELEELGNQLVEAKEDGDERVLTVWGKTEKVRGRITVLDSRTRLVHVVNDETTRKIPFLDIMKVSFD